MLKTRQGAIIGNGAPPAGRLTDEEIFLTRAEAAAYLRVSIPTLERWAAAGKGPRYRIFSRRALYSLADLRHFAGIDGGEVV